MQSEEEFGMSDLQNSVALVTVGSRGEEAGAVAEAIRKSGGCAAAFGADVSMIQRLKQS